MYSRIILLVAALLMSNVVSSQEIDVQLSSDSARFMYLTEAFGQDFGRLELEAGFLYSQNGSNLLNVGLLVRGESVSIPLVVAIGARVYYAKQSPYTVGAMAVGGDLQLAPESWGGLGIGAFFFTAPGVVTFGDANALTEYGVYVNFQVTPQAKISGGYQKIDASIKNVGTIKLDDGVYFGLNLSF